MHIDETLLYRVVGDNLRQRRMIMGMTQTQLAEVTGMLRTSITNIEAGRQKAPLHVLYRMCAALHIEAATILPKNAEIFQSHDPVYSINAIDAEVPPQTAEFVKGLLEE